MDNIFKSEEEIKEYINSMSSKGKIDQIIFSLKNVIESTIGFSTLSHRSGLTRESLYKSLSPETGNPHLSSFLLILKALDLTFTVSFKKNDEFINNNVNNKSIIETHPDVFKEWHPTKNSRVNPLYVSAHSKRKYWWQCLINKDHSYEATCHSKTFKKSICSFCADEIENEIKKLKNKLKNNDKKGNEHGKESNKL